MFITLNIPDNFSLRSTVYSHGWSSLRPFSVDNTDGSLHRAIELNSGKIICVKIRQKKSRSLQVTSDQKTNSKEKNEILRLVKTCLRIDEDYRQFFNEVAGHRKFRWIAREGAGRLLRAPTVFEDVIKMICTTNCSWNLTKVMVNNLCLKLGRMADEDIWTFPAPSAISVCSEKYIRREIRAGYRAPYILELSRLAANGVLDIESWRCSDLPAADLYKQIRSLKGIGPYAAANILKLVGRYDYLGIDSWCRRKFAELYKKGRPVKDGIIERYYQSFGKWRGLIFWLDLTKEWHNRKFPLK